MYPSIAFATIIIRWKVFATLSLRLMRTESAESFSLNSANVSISCNTCNNAKVAKTVILASELIIGEEIWHHGNSS
jgi:hypothetical protein